MLRVAELKEFELFADLDDAELEKIAKTGTLEKVKAGHEVFAENERATTLYLVEAGKVAIRMRSRRGQEVVVDELDPGELFGWSAILGDHGFTAGAWTMEDCALIAFDGNQLRRLFAEDHLLAYRVTGTVAGVISRRLTHLRSRLVDEPFAPEWLSSPAQERHAGLAGVSPTSEMRSISCPDCGTVNPPRAVVNQTEQYRCRKCGMVYYSPAGCERPEAGR